MRRLFSPIFPKRDESLAMTGTERAGREGRGGKTQHGVVHVEPVFEPGLSARQPSDALGIGHVGHAMGDEYTRLRQRSLRQRLHSLQEADERDCRIGGTD